MHIPASTIWRVLDFCSGSYLRFIRIEILMVKIFVLLSFLLRYNNYKKDEEIIELEL